MWNPYMLKQFLFIWQEKKKLKLRIPTLEKLTAQMLRRLVLGIRDDIKSNNNSEVLQVETEYYATIHPQSKKWEIESFSYAEQKKLLTLLAAKIKKSYEVDEMTRDETWDET